LDLAVPRRADHDSTTFSKLTIREQGLVWRGKVPHLTDTTCGYSPGCRFVPNPGSLELLLVVGEGFSRI